MRLTLKQAKQLMKEIEKGVDIIPVGSVIREKKYPNDIDIISLTPIKKLKSYLLDHFKINKIDEEGNKLLFVNIKYKKKNIDLNFWYSTKKQLPYFLFSFSYPRNFIIRVKAGLKRKGYNFSQYGIKKGNKYIKSFNYKGKRHTFKRLQDFFLFLQSIGYKGYTYRSPKEQELKGANFDDLYLFGDGLIGQVSDEDLLKKRNPIAYTDDEKKTIDLLSLKDALVNPIGSFTFEVQKYPSDIDIDQFIEIKYSNDYDLIRKFKELIINILSDKNTYFSDFKAGLDLRFPNDRDKLIVRWTPEEIIAGFKILPGNINLNLLDAMETISPVKLDIIRYVDDRFIEASTFFWLTKKRDGEIEFINRPDNYEELFEVTLKNEVKKYSSPETFKIFKAVKRMWSLARLKGDIETLKKLQPIIISNLSLLSQINADLETITFLYEKGYNVQESKLKKAIELMIKKISTIADIHLNQDELYNHLLNIITNKDIEDKIHSLEYLHEYLLDIINKETVEYMTLNHLLPINSNYLPSPKAGGRMRKHQLTLKQLRDAGAGLIPFSDDSKNRFILF